MKKNILIFAVLLVISSLRMTALASGDTVLTTSIPCPVSLDVGAGGQVTVNGENYTGKTEIRIAYGTETTFAIKPDFGNKIARVLYNGEDVTDKLQNGKFAVTLTQNASFTVTFEQNLFPSTSDNSRLLILSLAMLISFGMIFILKKQKAE